MANKIITGSGVVATTDYTTVTWTGKTKSGKPIIIELQNAINKENIDWTLAEKDEVVASLTFEACYDNTDSQADDTTIAPWKITTDDTTTSGASEIMLGLGVFAINGVDVALCRGGGQFVVEREFRDMAADGDKGSVKDRVVLDSERAKLTMNALTFLTNIEAAYPGIKVTEEA